MDAENSAAPIGFTLWGDPIYRNAAKRGRPAFEWTQENSHKVSMLLAMGWTNERIAGTILDPRSGKPISTPTLKRHFRSELDVRDQARDQLMAKQLMAAAGQAFSGNVGAQRFLQALIERNDMALLDHRHSKKGGKKSEAAPDAPAPLANDRLGKKAARLVAAQDIPDDYGDIFARRRKTH